MLSKSNFASFVTGIAALTCVLSVALLCIKVFKEKLEFKNPVVLVSLIGSVFTFFGLLFSIYAIKYFSKEKLEEERIEVGTQYEEEGSTSQEGRDGGTQYEEESSTLQAKEEENQANEELKLLESQNSKLTTQLEELESKFDGLQIKVTFL